MPSSKSTQKSKKSKKADRSSPGKKIIDGLVDALRKELKDRENAEIAKILKDLK